VFNAPGANANAVKELTIAAMLLAARNVPLALRFAAGLEASPGMDQAVEKGKKQFAGIELAGRSLGVIGLGKIGCLVADSAIKLGMNVLATIPRSPSTPPGACLHRCERRRAWPSCSRRRTS